MCLSPTSLERLARARTDLRLGLPVTLVGDKVTLAVAAEEITPQRLAALREFGDPVLAITGWRAKTLKARAYDGDLARLAIAQDASTDWIRAVADPADDLRAPMKGPFFEIRDGDATAARTGIALAKSAHLLPAAVVVTLDTPPPEGLTTLTLDELAEIQDRPTRYHDVVSGRVPLEVSEAGRVHVFRPDDGGEEHYAAIIGTPDPSKPVLTRLHSACFTGDILGSLKCDCGPQLKGALHQMAHAGAGILLYLNQEGRGIGLANKMRAYSLQDQGFDTVESNHRLGFEDDERDFRIGAGILKELGHTQVRLLTNNPAKVNMLTANGVEVIERVPLKVGHNPLNAKYLDVKAKKSGHIL